MEMHDLCGIAVRETRSVLATVIKVEGHAYRKQGVSMLLTEGGSMYGSISPGCLEDDLLARVGRVLESETMELASYDMRPEDDLSWGETIGCGGLVIVLLEPVISELRFVMQQMQCFFDAGETVSFTRSFDEGSLHVKYDLTGIKPGQVNFSTQKDFTIQKEKPETFRKQHLSLLSPKEHQAETWNFPLQIMALYRPKPRLIIIGAGNDVIPVARLSHSAGFRVVIADWRASLCTSERFPEAELVQGFPREFFAQLCIDEQDYIILMSHQFPREREMLELLTGSKYAYLGIMGSRTRTARLLEGLTPPEHVHSPVGMPIGADGPEEIAISIASELIACRRKRNSEFPELMKGKRSGVYANDRYTSGGW